jgi:5-methylcytosine-specific restriction endonuclease McrA
MLNRVGLTRSCAICDRRRPLFSRHRCVATAGYDIWSNRYRGVVRRSRKIVWGCRHDHRRRRDALACAHSSLKSFQRHGIPQSIRSQHVPLQVRDGRRISNLSSRAWEDMKAELGYRCYYCGRSTNALEQEHRIPISRGGASVAANIVPACHPCNQDKRSLTEAEFLARRFPRGVPPFIPAAASALEGIQPNPSLLPPNVPENWIRTQAWKAWGAPVQMIRGTHYYRDAIRAVARVTSDPRYAKPSAILLIREPTNRHDGSAIRAEVAGQLVGYVAQGDAASLAPVLDGLGSPSLALAGVFRGGGRRHSPYPSVMVWPDRRITPAPTILSVMNRDKAWPWLNG